MASRPSRNAARAAAFELERARLERDERATLWPLEDLPPDGDRSAISGHIRELMTFARRIARTNVNVLTPATAGAFDFTAAPLRRQQVRHQE